MRTSFAIILHHSEPDAKRFEAQLQPLDFIKIISLRLPNLFSPNINAGPVQDMKCFITMVAVLGFVTSGIAQQKPLLDPKWQALIGHWIGEGDGKPGQGSGACSFQFDLERHVLVRRNHSKYPAVNGRPAAKHEDLMIIYPGAGADSSRAVYFDNEGHVIDYTVTWTGNNSVTFLSKPSTNAPQFRLTYKKAGDEKLSLSFEIAPPGKPDAFKPYLSGMLIREKK